VQNFISRTIDFDDTDGSPAAARPTTAALPPPHPGPPNGPSPNGAAAAHALQAVYLSNVLVYNDDDDDDDDANKKRKKKSSTPTTTEEWSCYGSTEVDILVLRPADDHAPSSKGGNGKDDGNDETIAAVAPYCSPGMTVRDIKGGIEQERTKTLRLGVLEVVYSTSIADEEEDETQTSGNRRRHPTRNNDKQPMGENGRDGTKRAGDDDPNGPAGKSTPLRVYESGKNVLKHMQINGKVLYDTLQDDFPSRTYEAGERIYHEFGKTFDRTVGMMKKMTTWLVGGTPPGDGRPDS
jgi:hypothetical protein